MTKMKSSESSSSLVDLIEQVSTDPANELLVKQLLDRFYDGADPTNLLPLIHSEEPAVIEVGMWIASELAADAAPILNEVVNLFSKRIRGVSFEALNCLTCCATPNEPELLFEGLRQLDSDDDVIVWKAQMFLCSLSDEAIVAVNHYASQIANQENHLRGLSMLQSPSVSSAQVVTMLDSASRLLRAYAAVASVKLSKIDSAPMAKALNASDAIVSEFAKSAIKLGVAAAILQ